MGDFIEVFSKLFTNRNKNWNFHRIFDYRLYILGGNTRCVHTLPTSINGIQYALSRAYLIVCFSTWLSVAERSVECIILSSLLILSTQSVREHRHVVCIPNWLFLGGFFYSMKFKFDEDLGIDSDSASSPFCCLLSFLSPPFISFQPFFDYIKALVRWIWKDVRFLFDLLYNPLDFSF